MVGKNRGASIVLLAILAIIVLAWAAYDLLLAPSDAGDQIARTVVDNHNVSTIVVSSYRGKLEPGKQPAVWVASHPVVALVSIREARDARWNTASGVAEGPMAGLFIYRPLYVDVESYIKGTGSEQLTIAQQGGLVDGVTMIVEDNPPLQEGDRAVVFLLPPGENVDGWTLSNFYLIQGSIAASEADGRELPVTELLSQLRAAAAAES